MRRALVLCILLTGCGRIGFDATGDAGDGDADALPAGRWRSVAHNGRGTCAIDTAGALWCWGLGFKANLGTGSTLVQGITRVGTASDFTTVALGDSHTCALRGDGTLWCMGTNDTGVLPGLAPFAEAIEPIRIGTATWKAIALHDQHTCGIQADDSLWCWGYGREAVLGNSTTADKLQPTAVTVSGVNTWRSVKTSALTTCGIQTDNTLWCWGRNNEGQVGDGSRTTRASPLQVGTGRTWIDVDVDDAHTCALEQTGELWCWGFNLFGQVGDGMPMFGAVTSPVRATVAPPLASVELGGGTTCGITAAGDALCWGVGEHGQLGRMIPTTPTAITVANNVAEIAAVADVTCYIDREAHLFCTGNNNYGQLGLPAGEGRTLAQSDSRSDWRRIHATTDHACGLTTGDELLCWGINTNGELAYGRPEDSQSPQATSTQFSEIALGGTMLGGFGSDGSVWMSGQSIDLAGRTLSPVMFAPAASTLEGAFGTSHGCRVLADNTLRCGGYNASGQLGNNTTTNSPGVLVAGTWRVIAAGYDSTCAVSTGNELSCWGRNDTGQLGIGSTTNALTPQTVTLTGATGPVDQLALGGNFTCARTSTGQIYCWGANDFGQLGNGMTTMSTTPVRMGTRSDWKHVAAGDWHACAIANDNTLWCWGHGDEGQIGPPFAMVRTAPGQVGGAEWLDVAAGTHFTCALKLDGTRWCVGSNAAGALGTGAAWRQQFTVIP